MNCINCNNKKLYHLKNGQVKCASCKKKFSLKKIEKNLNIINAFCQNKTANTSSIDLNLNYVTVKKKYDKYRQLIALHADEKYHNKQVIEYDEYIYLEHSKKQVKENIFDAINFMTFNYEDKVYNLLMPNLNKYKNQFLDEVIEENYFKEFSKFMMMNKIFKIQKKENIIASFWIFFEESIVKYKGINKENFIYYLKEIEFKFNYTEEEQKIILLKLVK